MTPTMHFVWVNIFFFTDSHLTQGSSSSGTLPHRAVSGARVAERFPITYNSKKIGMYGPHIAIMGTFFTELKVCLPAGVDAVIIYLFFFFQQFKLYLEPFWRDFKEPDLEGVVLPMLQIFFPNINPDLMMRQTWQAWTTAVTRPLG